ncbi:hypothetical protein EV175_001311 [Coemansia sp. RSA 1933]|nr:hypothetical protein EV175_001311 [Coemansia sp. RSA 1933]
MVGQQRSATLKAFVRVSKNSEGTVPDGKKAAPPAKTTAGSRRMSTRSQSAKTEHPSKSAPVAAEKASSVRKRKSVEIEVVQSQAKRVATVGASKPAMTTPTKKKATTIGAYFSASPKTKTAPSSSKKNTQPVDCLASANSREPLLPIAEQEPASTTDTEKNPLDGDGKTDAPGEKKTSKLRAKTNTLLERLRNRKRPQPADSGGDGNDAKVAATPPASAEVSAEAPVKEGAEVAPRISVTRDIQERIRERREAAIEQAPVEPGSASTFEAARVKTAADAQMRELKRQFVLIHSRAPGTGAALSSELRKLDELFQGLEHVALFGAQSVSSGVVYHKVRKGVESMAKRTFGWKELGQILALYPEAYAYSPVTSTSNGRRVLSLVLTPQAQGADLAAGMEARRAEFRRRLVARVADAHARFLVARGFSPADVASATVTAAGWHPAFDIETTPSVAPIPLPPAAASLKQPAASVAVFDKSKLKHLLGMRKGSTDPAGVPETRAETAVPVTQTEAPAPAHGLPTPSDSPALHPSTKDNAPSTETKKIKKSLASSAKGLLERIRAKQRAKEEATKQNASAIPLSTRSMHSRLPSVLDAISFLYYSERKSVLQLHYVAEKIGESKGLDHPDAVDHIVALARFVPEWCSVVDDQDPALLLPPSPDARLKIVRALSAKEAKERLADNITASLSN